MSTVRDLLKGLAPKPNQATTGQEVGVNLSAHQSAAPSTPGEPGELADKLIAERLRQAADQRAAFAQAEIERLKIRIDQLQSHVEDLASRNLPHGEVKADLRVAQNQLEEARADRTRAHEARQNTDLMASFNQGLNEVKGRRHGSSRDHGTEGTSVRSAVGKTGIGPAEPPAGPARRKL